MRLIKYAVLFLSALLLFSAPVFSAQQELEVGEVLYHQDFSEISNSELSGIVMGTSSTEESALLCDGKTLSIDVYDDGRVYALLPKCPWTDSFTVEFDFSFEKINSTYGYIGLMLTSAGEKPDNISSVIFRANGTVDDFEEMSADMVKRLTDGEKIKVKVPVEKGTLQKIIVTSGDLTEELDRDSILMLGSGNRGFTVRNVSIDISEIYIVNGTNYEKKTGYWAETSYIEDDKKQKPSDVVLTAPPTSDDEVVTGVLTVAASAAALKRMKK